jgi:hypothetical protein
MESKSEELDHGPKSEPQTVTVNMGKMDNLMQQMDQLSHKYVSQPEPQSPGTRNHEMMQIHQGMIQRRVQQIKSQRKPEQQTPKTKPEEVLQHPALRNNRSE